MSVSTILNLYACDIFRENELIEIYNDFCERVVVHGETVTPEDQQIFDRFIKHICAIMFGVKPITPIPNAGPSSAGSSTSNNMGREIQARGNFKHFTLIGENEEEIKKFTAMSKTLLFKLEDVGVITSPLTWLEQTFNEVLEYVLAGLRPCDRVGFILRNDNFANKPVVISFRRRDQLDSKVILATLHEMLQTNANTITSYFTISFYWGGNLNQIIL
ncbi:hypothetical protein FQR65_LT10276 [Abscondita terminalis]|nr:hypothetical protein FQR65_LT10276 [Abscondita terminalis]